MLADRQGLSGELWMKNRPYEEVEYSCTAQVLRSSRGKPDVNRSRGGPNRLLTIMQLHALERAIPTAVLYLRLYGNANGRHQETRARDEGRTEP